MRLLLLFFTFLIFSTQIFAQGIALLNAEPEKTVVPGAEVKTSFQIKNTTNKAIRLGIKALNPQTNNDQLFSLCYGDHCWDHLTSFETIPLTPGQTLQGLAIKFQAGFEISTYDLQLDFYNADNPAEHFSQTFKFTITDSFSNGIFFSQEGIKVSNAYPNPASSQASIDYSIMSVQTNASIVVHNLLGNKVTEVVLEKDEPNAKIFTDALDNGIYFYSLYIEGKRVATKKLVVKK